jgi:peptide/nickel transport system substrate-binding protein
LRTNPALNPAYATLEPIDSVTARDSLTIRVHYRRAFGEQVYLFTNDFQPLPAHLLASLPADSIATSPFARHPIGNGPFRWERREPGQFIELRADSTFFLGRPGVSRIVIRVAADPAARLNLLLSGETDAMDNVPAAQLAQVQADTAVRVLHVPNNLLLYALFNFRSATAPGRPHPILGDLRVREALTLALDRTAIARNIFGDAVRVPNAAQSQLWSWITGGTISTAAPDTARARALLADAGWQDSNGDGVLDRHGVPLALDLIYPGTSAPRDAFAVQAEARWKALGVAVRLERLEGPVWGQRHSTGKFDIDIVAVQQDPSPSSLAQSWSCAAANQAGSSNVAHWCDPVFDSLRSVAETAPDGIAAWRAVLDRMASQYPAIFIAAPANVVAVHRRFDRAEVMPVKQWIALWQWRVRPGADLPRDR